MAKSNIPTVNEILQERSISHSIYIERFKTQEIKEIIRLLSQYDIDTINALKTVNGVRLTKATKAALIQKIRNINKEYISAYNERIRGTAREFGEYEAGFQVNLMNEVIPFEMGVALTIPASGSIYSEIISHPFEGEILRDQVARLGKSRVTKITKVINQGYAEGATIQELTREIRGTQSLRFTDGVIVATRRQAGTLARTAIQHTASMARKAVYEANDDVVKGYEWVSTLDGRTTYICMGLDGRVWYYNAPEQSTLPREQFPPAHQNCRSTTVPVTYSWKELGIDRAEVAPGTRASMNGQVPTSLKYNDWLKTQSSTFQKEVLGANRYKLFKEGTPVTNFTDNKQKTLTLKELGMKDDEIIKGGRPPKKK